jgi:hypothetical protein
MIHYKKYARDFLACLLGRIMRHFALDPRYFTLWQKNGFHVTQVHFYSAIPDTRELDANCFKALSTLPGIDIRETSQLELLEVVRSDYALEYEALSNTCRSEKPRFYFGNDSFESVDAEMLYGVVRHFKPRKFIEIGSGYSTLLTAQALQKNLEEGCGCEFIAIDPFLPDFLRGELPVEVEIKECRVQSVPLKDFQMLGSGDILFIDSSHVCKIESDVKFEFLEILPRLAPGVIVHIHDIFCPLD